QVAKIRRLFLGSEEEILDEWNVLPTPLCGEAPDACCFSASVLVPAIARKSNLRRLVIVVPEERLPFARDALQRAQSPRHAALVGDRVVNPNGLDGLPGHRREAFLTSSMPQSVASMSGLAYSANCAAGAPRAGAASGIAPCVLAFLSTSRQH